MKKIVLDALVQNLNLLNDFVHRELKDNSVSLKTQNQIDLAVEEIFVNIASYAYGNQLGKVDVSIQTDKNPLRVTIIFTDSGVSFNPLAKEDPDVTLGANERSIGGLGIFLTKKYMDSVDYCRKEDKNIFTMVKNLE